jgi:hypothetical protein
MTAQWHRKTAQKGLDDFRHFGAGMRISDCAIAGTPASAYSFWSFSAPPYRLALRLAS